MYGLVNKAVREFIEHRFGKEVWLTVHKEVCPQEDVFVGMESYPDQVTYQLVQSASRLTGVSPALILEGFGEYWITYTAREGYGNLLDLAGNTFYDFLQNLDHLHSCVSHIMPRLSPPSFRCEKGDDGTLILHYYSTRQGLASMVVGLLKGLGKRFGTPCSIDVLQQDDVNGHHILLLTPQHKSL